MDDYRSLYEKTTAQLDSLVTAADDLHRVTLADDFRLEWQRLAVVLDEIDPWQTGSRLGAPS